MKTQLSLQTRIITAEFKESQKSEQHPKPAEELWQACKGAFPSGMKLLVCTELKLSVSAEPVCGDGGRIARIIRGAAIELFGSDEALSVVVEKQSGAESLKARIDALVGAEEFKSLCEEIISIAPQVKQYSTESVFASRSYLFSIEDGCGLSTYVCLLASLLTELELFVPAGEKAVIEVRPTRRKAVEPSDAYLGALAEFKHTGAEKKGQVFCIDLSEWMDATNEKDFREMLSLLESHSEDNIFIFRIPFVENDVLRHIKSALSDVMFIREVTFTPFGTKELEQCAELILQKNGYSMSSAAWDVFDTRISEEKSDGRFYGINTVRKVVGEMIFLKQLSNVRNLKSGTLIEKSDIKALAATYSHKEKTASEMLSELVGMERVAKRIEEIVSQIKAAGSAVEPPCLHMQFIGNAGTGKTTAARIIGKMLKENGVLRNGAFFEYSGRDFCGRFVGETAPKTAGMCRDAYGSVLFIDEAYSLYRGDDCRDFGREALDTLIAEMENHRSELVVIMAGYADEMQVLMQGNLGLKSRMPYTIVFPNYTKDQLFEIFRRLLIRNFSYDGEILPAAEKFFTSLPDSFISSREFSNARFVRNLYERTWGKAAMRSRLGKEKKITVTREDFLQASAEKEFSDFAEARPRTFGFN